MLRKIWIELRSSLWFVPGLLVCAGIALALGLVELDVRFYGPLRAKSWQPLLSAGEEGARGMLAAIAGSMITVAGVAFSITIVTLSLASTSIHAAHPAQLHARPRKSVRARHLRRRLQLLPHRVRHNVSVP